MQEHIVLQRNITELTLKNTQANETYLQGNIDGSDHRITFTDFSGLDKLEEEQQKIIIGKLCKELEERFGGKAFLVVPQKYVTYFAEAGFSANVTSNPNTARVCQTTLENITKNMRDIEFPGYRETFTFITDVQKFSEISEEQITQLMKKCGFTEQKIQSYLENSAALFKVICAQPSQPFGLLNTEGALVAFCRITDLGNGIGYLSDTLIDTQAFAEPAILKNLPAIDSYFPEENRENSVLISRVQGTAYLYYQMAQFSQEQQVNLDNLLLIAPPKEGALNRSAEFAANFGCEMPKAISETADTPVVMVRFSQGKPELAQTLQDQKEQMQAQLVSPKFAEKLAGSMPFLAAAYSEPSIPSVPTSIQEQPQQNTFKQI